MRANVIVIHQMNRMEPIEIKKVPFVRYSKSLFDTNGARIVILSRKQHQHQGLKTHPLWIYFTYMETYQKQR